MPRRSPYRIVLDKEQRQTLESLARSYTLPYWQVVRAQMVLMAAEGLGNDEIARRLNCRREVVSQWRKRFFEQGVAGRVGCLRLLAWIEGFSSAQTT